jgi:Icc protein
MPQRVLRLLHITDPHLHATEESCMRGVNTWETFSAVLARALSDPSPPDAIVATGDLVQDETRAGYERFKQSLESYDLPVYCIPGNHDAPNIMNEVLSEPPFQVGGQARHGNWSLIFLNSFSPGDDGGRLSPDELQFVEESLKTDSAIHALICIHHHPVPMGSRWLDGVGLRNSAELLEITDRFPHVRGILWGHVHQESDRRRKGIRLMSTPSTCSQFRPNSDDFALDARPPGYRWLDLRINGTIDTEVVWLE